MRYKTQNLSIYLAADILRALDNYGRVHLRTRSNAITWLINVGRKHVPSIEPKTEDAIPVKISIADETMLWLQDESAMRDISLSETVRVFLMAGMQAERVGNDNHE